MPTKETASTSPPSKTSGGEKPKPKPVKKTTSSTLLPSWILDKHLLRKLSSSASNRVVGLFGLRPSRATPNIQEAMYLAIRETLLSPKVHKLGDTLLRLMRAENMYPMRKRLAVATLAGLLSLPSVLKEATSPELPDDS